MKKNMMDNLLSKFTKGFKDGYFVRVGAKNLNIFIGKDEEGRFCFEYKGVFTPIKIIGSKPLDVNQYYWEGNIRILRFSLEHNELIGCFSAFCEDLLESVSDITDENAAYNTITSRYMAWRKLFKPNRSMLSENEIMGLIGELLFLKDKAIPMWGIDVALDSWTGAEKTHKDFSCGNSWFEIKTIAAGRETVKISSIEQLDSETDGELVIYSLEKMSPSYNGITLNALVKDIVNSFSNTQKDFCLNKLELFGFDFDSSYDNFVYAITDTSFYHVPDSFPRLKRLDVPLAISKAQYDLIISEISPYKLQNA